MLIVWVWLVMSLIGLFGAGRILRRSWKRRQEKLQLPKENPVRIQASFRFWSAVAWTVGMLFAVGIAAAILLDLGFQGISVFVIILLQAIAVGTLTWDDQLDVSMNNRRINRERRTH